MKNKKATYSSIIAIISVLIVILITLIVSKNIGMNKNENLYDAFIEEDGGIPTVDTFDKLYEILKIGEKSKEETTEENLVNEEETDELQKKIETTTDEVEKKEFELASNNYNYYCLNNILYICYGEKVISSINFESSETEINTLKNVLLDENKITVIYTKKYINQENERNIYTITEMYNIKNKKRPRFEREVKIEGEYYNFKRIDNTIYIFTKKEIDLLKYYGKTLEEINSDDFKIQYLDTNNSDEPMFIDFTEMYYFEETEYTEYLNIIGIDLNDECETIAETYLGVGDEISILNSSFYIIKTIYNFKDPTVYGYYDNLKITSYIYKFDFWNRTLNYLNYVEIDGDVINDITQTNGYLILISENYTTWESENKTYNICLFDSNLNKIIEKNNVVPEQIIENIKINDSKIFINFKDGTTKEFHVDILQDGKPQII